MESQENNLGSPAGRPKRRKLGLIASLVILALVLLPYLLIDPEPEVLDPMQLSTQGRQFVKLTDGHTFYEAAGPATAQTVVLVHGTTIPSFVWDPGYHALAGAGLRVIRYDLYGRGLSERPESTYDMNLYVRQLEELLAKLAPGVTVDLAGLSLGAIVVSEFTRRFPERVRKVVLIGPAGVGTRLPLAAKIGKAPLAGEYIMHVLGASQLLPTRRNVYEPERHARLDAEYLPTIRYKGSRRAVLETLRNVPMLYDFEAGYAALGRLKKPLFVIWGRHDAVAPFTASEQVNALLRPESFLAVDEAGHLAHYEQPEVVNPALIGFLMRR